MRTINIFILLVLCTIYSCNATKQLSNKAHTEVESRLNIIKSYLENNNADPSLRRVEAISFLENLTGIMSESDGNDIGKMDPTESDFQKWNKWYLDNKSIIYWDKKQQKVLLRD